MVNIRATRSAKKLVLRFYNGLTLTDTGKAVAGQIKKLISLHYKKGRSKKRFPLGGAVFLCRRFKFEVQLSVVMRSSASSCPKYFKWSF